MLDFSRDICDLLQARASNGHAAFAIAEVMLAKTVAALRRDPRFTGITMFEFEPLFAAATKPSGRYSPKCTPASVLDDAEDGRSLHPGGIGC